MGLRRFFFNPTDRDGDFITLSKDESKHIRVALRPKTGENIELLDGAGKSFLAEIIEIDDLVLAKVLEENDVVENKNSNLWLGQALLKGKKVDELIPRCTELGVVTLMPFQSARCQGRLNAARAAKKHERWQRIVDESCKQCGRAMPMQINDLVDFSQMIEELGETPSDELRIFFWEEEQELLLSDLRISSDDFKTIRIILGPEGGFPEEEAMLAIRNGWKSVSLGQRVLKADTVTVAVVSLMQFLAGNFG